MNLKGMASIVSQLRAQRADFVNQIGHIDAALIVLGKSEWTRSGGSAHDLSRWQEESAQRARWAKIRGKAKVATQTNDVSIIASQNSSCAATTLGEAAT